MKIWALTRKNNNIKKDKIFTNDTANQNEVHQLIEKACDEFDIGKPLFLSKNQRELLDFQRTVFYPADFIETIDFDTLEIEIILEDK